MEQEKLYNTLNEVKVEKTKLLETLKKNLKKHNEVHEESLKIYTEMCKSNLEKVANDAKKAYKGLGANIKEWLDKAEKRIENKEAISCHESPPTYYNMETPWWPSYPTSYAFHYEKAIKWLEYSVESHVVLNDEEFRNLVMDEWEFKKELHNRNTEYVRFITGASLSGFNTNLFDKQYY